MMVSLTEVKYNCMAGCKVPFYPASHFTNVT